jgi:hypothetical protein
MSAAGAETFPGELPASLRRRRLVVRWSAQMPHGLDGPAPQRSAGVVELVVALELVDGRCAIVEGWLAGPDRTQVLVPRQPAPCSLGLDHRLLHIDVSLNDERTLALSLEPDTERLFYARSALLGRAGLVAGAFDPPRMTVEAVAEEAASA